MKIRILFRRTGKGDYKFSQLIGWWTKKWNPKLKYLPNYSHAELEFCDRWWNISPYFQIITYYDVGAGERCPGRLW